ncbi:hypothetical protein KFL_000600310 [Klebsormidium nitens]|uniref:DCD domain-containing protein n=1 Tax=Klebsormidium nitens TaxID=105231 RepID=A0A1Y1HQ06_KLENI|nr:hypothetical protein KFL_000600310 [Klebsormidium nitens]|eukprot:GAQ80714.1 hypothetical protein KFL_000600310 [Klebsormidium nitens]
MAHMRRAENSDTRSQGFDRGRGHLNHHSDRPRYSPPFEGELGGHLFLTNHQQIEENFARQIFGLPKQHAPTVLRIKEGLPLFLYNTSTRALHGVFEAASDGGLNLEPDAWQDHALSAQLKQPFSKFPAQVRFRVRADRGRLAEPKFRDILDYHTSDYNTHFRLPLSIEQANHLLELFNMAPSGPRPAPPTAEQPSAAGDVIDEGDWEQVKTKPRTKPLKVQPGNSYGRQVGSPTGPSTPRRRAEGPRPGHQGPVGNGDVGGGRGGPDRWRPDGGDWAARAGGRQHTGSVWGAREGAAKEGGAKEGALKEDAGVGRAEERGSKAEVRENGILETGPAKLSPRKPGAQAAKEAPFSSPREAGILGSGSAAVEQAEGKGQVAESVTTVADPPAKPGKAAVKSSTFSYSAALKVGLPAKMEDISASEKGRGGASDTAGKAGGAENESGEVFPVLSKSNSKNERVAKAPKKEHVAVVVKNEDGETKDADRKDTEKKDDEKEDAVKKDGVEKSGKKGDGEKKAEASKVGDDMSEKKDGKKVEAKKDAEKAAGDRKEAPKSKGDPLQAPKSPKSKSEAGEALVGAQKAEPSPPAKPEPVKAPEKPKPNPWGKLPTPIEPVSLAEVQQKEQEQQAELSHAARREPQAKPAIGDREGAVDRTKEAVALHEGGERREAAKPVGRGWEAKKPELQQPVVQVQAPQKGGGAFAPPLRQKTPPRMQHPQPLAARRGEPAPVTDLSALPPSAPERIQQRSMGNLVGGIPARNRTPPLSHHSHRPQPVQVPAPQSLGTGVRISPTATPYTPNSAGFTPSATPFTPSGRLSPGLRGYGPPMGVLQTPPPMFAADPSLAYDQSWRMPRGRNAPPPSCKRGGRAAHGLQPHDSP